MFYSVFVLGKKGPLARVWLAAHWDKKITKAQILETNISESVDSILQPRVKLSLRTSSHLLLGIVRIYARKTMYLLQDCQDAAFKIKSAFRPGTVDLPDGKTEAAFSAITLPEVLDFINDFDLITEPQINVDLPHTSTNIRNITLDEDVSSINVDDPILQWGSELGTMNTNAPNLKDHSNPLEVFNKDIPDDGFDPYIDEDIFPVAVPDQTLPVTAEDVTNEQINDKQPQSVPPRPDSRVSSRSDNSYGCPPSGPPSSEPPVTPGSPAPDIDVNHHDIDGHPELPLAEGKTPHGVGESSIDEIFGKTLPHLNSEAEMPKPRGRGAAKNKRRGAIIIDDPKTLSGEEMKAQLSDTSDTVCNLDLAPPSKKMMMWKKIGGSEKLFSLPERFMPSSCLLKMFSENCTTRQLENHEDENLLPAPIDYLPHQPLFDTSSLHPPIVNGEISPNHDQSYDPDTIPPTPGRPHTTKTKSTTKRKPKATADGPGTKRSHREPKHNNRDITASSEEAMRTHTKEISVPLLDDSPPPLEYEDDYRPPDSVYPTEDPEEQLEEGETIEQYEERIRNKRTNVLLRFMANELDTKGEVLFSQLVRANRKKVVGQKFFSLLVLKKQHAIELIQDPTSSYGEILISKGERYDESVSLSSF